MDRALIVASTYGNLWQKLRSAVSRMYAVAPNPEPDERTSEPPNPRTPERLLFAVLLLGASCSPSPRSYEQEIAAFRAEKDQAFKSGADSPIPEAQRAAFTGLRYFDVDPRLRLPAALTQSEASSQVIEM